MSAVIIAVASQKGGVGKTTTASNLAMCLSSLGEKILLIDLDPQGNASTGLGINKNARINNIYRVITGHISCRESIQKLEKFGFDLVPSVVDLAAAEAEILSRPKWQNILQEKIFPIVTFYDYIIMDCPPSLGPLTVNALTCANSVLIPLQCEFFALEGLSHLIQTIKLIRRSLNNTLYIHGILLTMYDKRNNLSAQVAEDIRKTLGDSVYETVIPRNVKLSEAASHGKPVTKYDDKCSGSIAYIALAQEIKKRDEKEKHHAKAN